MAQVKGQKIFNNNSGVGVQKIRLRRVPTKQEIIKKNLSNLKQNVQKKKAAQEYYYNQKKGNAGRSPLKRQGIVTNKSAIQNRLGAKGTMIFTNKNQQQKNMGQTNTNTAKNQNKPFLRKKFVNNQQMGGHKMISGNNLSNNRMQRFTKKQSVQQRLSQIRQGAQSAQTVQNKIKLRRPQPVNYQIQVQTNGVNMVVAKKKQPQHTVLNPQLQAEIKAIQSRVPALDILPAPQIAQPSTTFGTTTLTLNDRFTGLM